MFEMLTVPHATCVKGYNCFENAWVGEDSKFVRRVARIGLAGSAALGDSKFLLKYGNRIVAELQPTSVGAVFVDANDMITLSDRKVCLASENIALECDNAIAANNLQIVVDVQELPNLRRRY